LLRKPPGAWRRSICPTTRAGFRPATMDGAGTIFRSTRFCPHHSRHGHRPKPALAEVHNMANQTFLQRASQQRPPVEPSKWAREASVPCRSECPHDGPERGRIERKRPAAGKRPGDIVLQFKAALQPATSARTRSGLPDPFSILRGGVTSNAPVGGSWSRLHRLARPNLLAPCMR
jgi:hypothetical protein